MVTDPKVLSENVEIIQENINILAVFHEQIKIEYPTFNEFFL